MQKRIQHTNLLYIAIGFVIITISVMYAFFFRPVISTSDSAPPFITLSVGMDAEPDGQGWRTLFNGHTLDGWEITNFGPQGDVNIRDSAIILNYGDGCTGITWKKDFPVSDYQISLDARRLGGNDFFCGLTFPINEEHCTFIAGGWGGALVGLSSIDGRDASENSTQTLINFENLKWYSILVCVTEKEINCFIDHKPVVKVLIDDHKFSLRSEVELSKPLGICSWTTTAALKNIKFREIK